jgi:regulator of RNase E activity RraB
MSARDGEWEFYPCRVDDAPASIMLDLSFRDTKPLELDTLYLARLQMLEPGDHGMGVGADVEKLSDAEDAICEDAERLGLTYVGRLRTAGGWQLTFYGPAGLEKKLDEVVVETCGERAHRMAHREDGGWSYYDSFLAPDAERWQWILDRRVVHRLAEAGDHHATPRPVDHYVYFDEPDARDTFAAAAVGKGFEAETTKASEERPCGAHLVRTDRVELQHIHRVVMELRELADAHGGDYDGWGAPVMEPA